MMISIHLYTELTYTAQIIVGTTAPIYQIIAGYIAGKTYNRTIYFCCLVISFDVSLFFYYDRIQTNVFCWIVVSSVAQFSFEIYKERRLNSRNISEEEFNIFMDGFIGFFLFATSLLAGELFIVVKFIYSQKLIWLFILLHITFTLIVEFLNKYVKKRVNPTVKIIL